MTEFFSEKEENDCIFTKHSRKIEPRQAPQKILKERIFTMNSNKKVVPEAKSALDRFKMEVANEVGVNLKDGYNGDITAREAGSIGGQMVKKMVEAYENSIK